MSTYKPGAKVIKKTPAKPSANAGAKITANSSSAKPSARVASGPGAKISAKPAARAGASVRPAAARVIPDSGEKAGAKITANTSAKPARASESSGAKIVANTSARPGARPDSRPAGRGAGFTSRDRAAPRAKIIAKGGAKITPKGEGKTLVKNSPVVNRKKSADTYRLFAICPGGLDDMLRKEVEGLQANVLAIYPGGVEFEGDLEMAYLATLKLRTASRMLLMLKDFQKIFKPEELYVAIQAIDWTKIFAPTSTMAIYLTESQSTAQERRIPVNPQFWALKAKDAIVDQFQQKLAERPNIDRADPDITIRLHLHDQKLKVYLDLSGPSLHERGYRGKTLEAPMKENLAAGLLFLAGWDEASKEKTAFYDPFCGSGTLLIEAALIATRTAPGLFRNRFGFMSWNDHQPELFEKVYEKLKLERVTDPALIPEILGSDMSSEAVAIAQENLRRAGMEPFVKLKTERFENTVAPTPKGLIVTNPPYGVRLDEVEALKLTYQQMGSTFKHHYKGWTVAVITSEKTLLHEIALKPSKKWALHNGGLESQFSLFQLY